MLGFQDQLISKASKVCGFWWVAPEDRFFPTGVNVPENPVSPRSSSMLVRGSGGVVAFNRQVF